MSQIGFVLAMKTILYKKNIIIRIVEETAKVTNIVKNPMLFRCGVK